MSEPLNTYEPMRFRMPRPGEKPAKAPRRPKAFRAIMAATQEARPGFRMLLGWVIARYDAKPFDDFMAYLRAETPRPPEDEPNICPVAMGMLGIGLGVRATRMAELRRRGDHLFYAFRLEDAKPEAQEVLGRLFTQVAPRSDSGPTQVPADG